MEIWDVDKLLLFITFAVPGFIGLKSYELLIPGKTRESGERLIDAVTFSSVNYALLLPFIYEVETQHLWAFSHVLYVLFYEFVLFIAPICWASGYVRLRRARFFQGLARHPTEKPWDYVFGQRKAYWAIVTLKDGRQIAGLYDSESFASSAPAGEQIYLEEEWLLNSDGGFDRRKEDTAGIIILGSEMVTVELIRLRQEVGDVDKEQPTNIRAHREEGIPAGGAASAAAENDG